MINELTRYRSSANEIRFARNLETRRALIISLALLHAATCGCSRDYSRLDRTDHSSSSEVAPELSALHHAISTSNTKTQLFFDRGLTYFYAFNFAEAVKAFRRASELDPRSAMPYWGIALALGPNYNSSTTDQAAEAVIQKAKTLVVRAPENEKEYVDALSLRFADDLISDSGERNRAYASAMAVLSRNFPDDPDAATLYAASLMDLHRKELWTIRGQPGEDTDKIVGTLKNVLIRWPNHVGANHYYVHAIEASPEPQNAMASAKRLESLVPSAGHLVHMSAHIYARTGDFTDAVKSTLLAAKLDREYLRDNPFNTPYELGYADHNLLFLTAVAETEGNFDLAYKTSRDLESQARAMLGNSSMAESYLPDPLFVLLRFARWDEVLVVPKPELNLPGATFYWHYARGCAFAKRKQVEKARNERDEMETLFEHLPAGKAFGMLSNDWATINEIAVNSLNARIMDARGNLTGSIRLWRTAVATEDRMRYHEPSDWYYPSRESLGSALLRNNQWLEAEKVFKEDLIKNPSNPRSLFGLSSALEREKNWREARKYRQSFQSTWKGSPNKLRIADF